MIALAASAPWVWPALVAWAAIATYAALLVVRAALAAMAARRRGPLVSAAAPARAAVVLQPILSGDPDLERCLRTNVEAMRDCAAVRFVWLVDEDDPEGRAIAERLHAAVDGAETRGSGPRVRLLVGPPPRDGENPKVAKLARGLEQVGEDEVVVVLDDDTMVSAATVRGLLRDLAHADLATGLPVFVAARTVEERAVAAFVNGNAALTYLPAAAVGAQHTLNGMIYATPAATLRALGGFAAILPELTDDYALARLYERGGRRVLQTAHPAAVSMTLRDPGHCLRVLRRWLIFANTYLRENLGAWTLALVLLPSLAGMVGTLAATVAACGGAPLPLVVWLVCLVAKAGLNRGLLARLTAGGALPAGAALPPLAAALICEPLLDLFLPLVYVSAWIRPRQLRWRSRRIDLAGGAIKYR